MRFSHKFATAVSCVVLAFGAAYNSSTRAGLGAAFGSTFACPAQIQPPDPLTTLFRGREVSPPQSDPSVLQQLKGSKIYSKYEEVRKHPETALLISNCQVASQWCEKLDVVQFSKTLRVMAAIPKNPDPDKVIDNWIADFANKDDVDKYIGAQHDRTLLDRFQLLAVVNRMDVACFETQGGARAKSCD